VLTLEHSLVTAATAIDYGYGWEDFLNRLNELVAGRDPRSVSWLDAQRDLKPLWRIRRTFSAGGVDLGLGRSTRP
jgi:hypothetical protein